MNCDKCGKASVYHSKLIVNGVTQTTNLCRDCAIKEGVFSSSPTNIFDDMFSVFENFLPFEKVADIECPVCKLKLKEFKSTGRLGCPNCYQTFREEIANVIKRIAPFETHKQETAKKTRTTVAKQTKEQKIEALREEMKLAVKDERYEDAAKIKKQIQKLEAKDE